MGFIRWKKYGVYRQGKIMGFIGKEKLWGLYASLKNTRKTNKKK
jgi:hypothetical protein